MKPGDTVKYSNPTQDEQDLRFTLIEHNGDRVLIQLICEDTIKPIETIRTEEVEKA